MFFQANAKEKESLYFLDLCGHQKDKYSNNYGYLQTFDISADGKTITKVKEYRHESYRMYYNTLLQLSPNYFVLSNRGYRNQKVTTGGAAPCTPGVKPCPVGLACGVRKLSSRVGESQILQLEGFRQPRVAQMKLR